MSLAHLSFSFESLRALYERGVTTPHDVVDEVFSRIDRDRDCVRSVWLHVLLAADVHAAAARAIARRAAGEVLPLFGVPYAVKDNIDVAGAPTTAACPAFAYVPTASAAVVDRLTEAGAIVIGKVNLDQFATGLVGVRSPYGVPTNPFDPAMIPGGSSSGSAVAVAAGHVAFALGTDTAGSGRVPAALNNVVGLKPSRGALSTRGVVPACRSLDCVSVFALTVPDACAVADAARGWDVLDPFSRADAQPIAFAPDPASAHAPFRIGVAPRDQLVFFEDSRARAVYERALDYARSIGCTFVEVDLRPLREAGDMLYGAPWVVERLFSAGALFRTNPEALLPVLRDVLGGAARFGAADVFAALYRLRAIRQSVEPTWRAVDAILLPTAPTMYRIDEVVAQPHTLNANLGIYTTFLNLMDLAAIAVPAGLRSDGLPSGVSLIGPRGADARLATIAHALHRAVGGTLGATGHAFPADPAKPLLPPASLPDPTRAPRTIVVVGAHLSGQPLNGQLTTLGATLVRPATTAPAYRLFALRGAVPPKPGLVRAREGGRAIDVEVWSLDDRGFAAFVAAVPRPLCIGSVELDDGSFSPGFLCEPEALDGALEITHHGGWRAYLKAPS